MGAPQHPHLLHQGMPPGALERGSSGEEDAATAASAAITALATVVVNAVEAVGVWGGVVPPPTHLPPVALYRWAGQRHNGIAVLPSEDGAPHMGTHTRAPDTQPPPHRQAWMLDDVEKTHHHRHRCTPIVATTPLHTPTPSPALPPRLFSRANHSCRPSASYCVRPAAPRGARIALRTLRPLAPGDQVSVSYTDPTAPTQHRRHDLASRYAFTCGCPRCVARPLPPPRLPPPHLPPHSTHTLEPGQAIGGTRAPAPCEVCVQGTCHGGTRESHALQVGSGEGGSHSEGMQGGGAQGGGAQGGGVQEVVARAEMLLEQVGGLIMQPLTLPPTTTMPVPRGKEGGGKDGTPGHVIILMDSYLLIDSYYYY